MLSPAHTFETKTIRVHTCIYAHFESDTHAKTHKLTHRVWCTASSWWHWEGRKRERQHTHTHTFSLHCPALPLLLYVCYILSSLSHTLASSFCIYYTHTHTHTRRQMSSTLKLNGWPDGESLSFSNKDLSLLSLHPASLSLHLTHTHMTLYTDQHTYPTFISTITHVYVRKAHTPYGCIITVSEAALRNNYRGWLLLLLLLFPTNKPVHKQDGGVSGRSSHLCDAAVMQQRLLYLNVFCHSCFLISVDKSMWTPKRRPRFTAGRLKTMGGDLLGSLSKIYWNPAPEIRLHSAARASVKMVIKSSVWTVMGFLGQMSIQTSGNKNIPLSKYWQIWYMYNINWMGWSSLVTEICYGGRISFILTKSIPNTSLRK